MVRGNRPAARTADAAAILLRSRQTRTGLTAQTRNLWRDRANYAISDINRELGGGQTIITAAEIAVDNKPAHRSRITGAERWTTA